MPSRLNGHVYVIQRSEPSLTSAVGTLKFVTVYANKEEAIVFCETGLEQLHAQMLTDGFHKIIRKEVDNDVTIGLVNMKTDTTIVFYVIQRVAVL